MPSTAQNLDVVYQDNHLIVINKQSGDIVQGDKTGDTPLSDIVKSYIKEKYQKPGAVYLGVVHRLDRPTTGLVLFARTSKALPRLNKLFAEKEVVTKTYWAVVKQRPPKIEDTLIHWMTRNPQKNKSTAHSKECNGSKRASLHYRLIATSDRYSLLEVTLHTGRHHQIRAQLAAIGCPIKGDLKYGYDRSNPDGSIHLHARYLSLIHPVRSEERLEFTANVPKDTLWKALEEAVAAN